MEKYYYKSVLGTKQTIEVEQKWFDIMREMDKQELKQNFNRERPDRHYQNQTFGDGDYDGYEHEYATVEYDFLETDIDDPVDPIVNAIKLLPQKYQHIATEHYLRKKTAVQIAKELGVERSAVSHKLARIRKKLEAFL